MTTLAKSIRRAIECGLKRTIEESQIKIQGVRPDVEINHIWTTADELRFSVTLRASKTTAKEEFKARLRRSIQENQAILELLAKED